MTGPQVDYIAVFRQLPIPVMLLTPDFVIADVNLAYTEVAGRKRDELLGRNAFDVFPDNPLDPHATGVQNLSASMRQVVATGERDVMAPQKYDVEMPGRPGQFEERYWCPVNAPLFGADGQVELIVHCVEEVTGRIRMSVAERPAGA